ncbi:PEPxxWA-CTERM sorting domain-containing protein [Phenylobacterium sp.]|uniref:PEPxxWA-CTERM sorting domain-containing protein n=1 Tax=Phenylobacterium sp. TaxID=1871053 RepID=UPI0025F51867|nr:PEPxxWA-CTERM sorting domain-containing protein [Phenylobacterium sp.]
MKSFLSLVAGAALLAAGPAAAAQFTNGSFEQPAGVAAMSLMAGSTFLPGWTVVDSVPGGDADIQYTSNAAYGSVGVTASDGEYLLDLTGSVGRGKGVASDPIDVVAGASYRVGFDVGAFYIRNYGSFGDATVDLLVNDVLAGSFTNVMNRTAPGSDWQRFTYDFVATGPTVKLTFLSSTSLSSSSLGVGLDNVAFDLTSSPASGAPEPASWALMIAGFAGVGAAVRRRRAAAA